MAARKGSPVDEDGLTTKISKETRRLSTRPSAIRRRIRKNGNRAAEDIALYIELQYKKPVEEWTIEELRHGRPRHPTGGWKGPRPAWITPVIQAEVRRRLRDETLESLMESSGAAVKVLVDFLKNPEEPALRFRAAALILEYTIGAPEKQVTINGNIQLQSMLASALVLEDGSPAHPVIEGETIIDDEDEDDDDDDEE